MARQGRCARFTSLILRGAIKQILYLASTKFLLLRPNNALVIRRIPNL
jgi:hypothetical protein